MRQLINGMAFVLSLSVIVGCTQKQEAPKATAIKVPVEKRVTRANYLSGHKFCETYSEITGKEFAKRVMVPVDYQDPSKGQIEIYSYMNRAFDLKKSTLVFVDGGPGQNTHGEKDLTGGQSNEIKFDQRGLGCSAPDSYDLYSDWRIYSSENTIRDMEEIRKAWGISQWSVYGVSYGTVPATMYGSKFPEVTVSVVLEGIIGNLENIHALSYKAEKANLALAKLSFNQRNAFNKLIQEESADTKTIVGMFFEMFYYNQGMQKVVQLLKLTLNEKGEINRSMIAQIRDALKSKTDEGLPQQPSAVDSNILNTLFCKELGNRNFDKVDMNYSSSMGFYTYPSHGHSRADECDKLKISIQDEKPYKLEDYPVKKNVYYFQGSHDAATMAKGAIEHWKKVPQGQSYFMLSQKGGHNPNIGFLASSVSSIASCQKNIFNAAVLGLPIQQKDIELLNVSVEENRKWVLYLEIPKDMSLVDKELESIKSIDQAL